MPNTLNKPIAILAYSIAEGVNYILATLGDNVAKYESHRRLVTDKQGQQYVVINNQEQLLGWEISDYRIAPGFGKHTDVEARYIVHTAKERMR